MSGEMEQNSVVQWVDELGEFLETMRQVVVEREKAAKEVSVRQKGQSQGDGRGPFNSELQVCLCPLLRGGEVPSLMRCRV